MGVTVRPIEPSDVPELRRIHEADAVARWWGMPPDDFPEDEPEAIRLTIVQDDAVAGMIQYVEETEPRYRHAAIDLFVDPALHGRGIGPEAIERVVESLVSEGGHHRFTIDPACANVAAIRAYEKAGFEAVGVMRRYERDPTGAGWRDGLLMERLAGGETGEL